MGSASSKNQLDKVELVHFENPASKYNKRTVAVSCHVVLTEHRQLRFNFDCTNPFAVLLVPNQHRHAVDRTRSKRDVQYVIDTIKLTSVRNNSEHSVRVMLRNLECQDEIGIVIPSQEQLSKGYDEEQELYIVPLPRDTLLRYVGLEQQLITNHAFSVQQSQKSLASGSSQEYTFLEPDHFLTSFVKKNLDILGGKDTDIQYFTHPQNERIRLCKVNTAVLTTARSVLKDKVFDLIKYEYFNQCCFEMEYESEENKAQWHQSAVAFQTDRRLREQALEARLAALDPAAEGDAAASLRLELEDVRGETLTFTFTLDINYVEVDMSMALMVERRTELRGI
jgi:hypothetical protein